MIDLAGNLDAKTVPEVQEQMLSISMERGRIVLDISGVEYVSSAGLRMLLLLYRQLKAKGGKIILVGVSEEITDVMSNTGLLNFFQVAGTAEEGASLLI